MGGRSNDKKVRAAYIPAEQTYSSGQHLLVWWLQFDIISAKHLLLK